MLYHGGAKAHPVMRLAETRVVGSLNQLIDRGTVAVCAVEVSPFVEAEAKGLDLTVTPEFDALSVWPEPEDISGLHFDV